MKNFLATNEIVGHTLFMTRTMEDFVALLVGMMTRLHSNTCSSDYDMLMPSIQAAYATEGQITESELLLLLKAQHGTRAYVVLARKYSQIDQILSAPYTGELGWEVSEPSL